MIRKGKARCVDSADMVCVQEYHVHVNVDAHHLEDARVQSPGVCTQSVMSTVAIRSNLMGRQRTDHRCRK